MTKFKWVTAAILDDYLLYASNKPHELEALIKHDEDLHDENVRYEDRLIPEVKLQAFLNHGTSDQEFSDGYEAYTEWKKYNEPRYDKGGK